MRSVWHSQRSCLHNNQRSLTKENIMDTINSSNNIVKKTFKIKNEFKNYYRIVKFEIIEEKTIFI